LDIGVDINDCSGCKWRQYCYSNSETWELSPEEYEEFKLKKDRCDAELLAACSIPAENNAEINIDGENEWETEVKEIIKKYSG